MLMSKTVGIRLNADELELLLEALKIDVEQRPGDRGGVAAWLRRVGLREARRVVEQRSMQEDR